MLQLSPLTQARGALPNTEPPVWAHKPTPGGPGADPGGPLLGVALTLQWPEPGEVGGH